MNEAQALDQFAPACNLYAGRAFRMYGSRLPHTREDYFQLAQHYVVFAVREFDPNKGMKLSTYIIQRIRWGLLEVTRKENTSHVPMCSITSAKKESDWIEPEYEDCDPEGWKEGFEAIISDLNDEERKLIIARFVHERQYHDIAKDYGITKQGVQERVSRILRKLSERTNLVAS